MKRLIIFDMDGVLVNSEPATIAAAIEALRNWGIEADPAEFKQFTGMGEDRFVGGPAENHGLVFVPEMKQLTYEIYGSRAKNDVLVYPWSLNVLKELKKRGYALAVASAADRIKVDINLSCIGVSSDYFDAVVTGIDVERKKPAPDIFIMAAKKAGYSPDECVVVEDALSGVTAGKAAGMTTVAVTTSFPSEKLTDAGADFVTDDLSVLPELIKEL